MSTHGVVLLLVACLLRAMLPAGTSGPARAPGDSFRCQGHACGCASAEACRRACCCESEGTRTVSESNRESIPLLRALECHGFGSGNLAAQSEGWIAVLPRASGTAVAPATWSNAIVAWGSIRNRRPEPSPPPPRRSLSVA